MSSKRLEDQSSRRSQDISSRRLEDVYWECLLIISVSEKSRSVSDRSLFHISISDKSIQNLKSKMH